MKRFPLLFIFLISILSALSACSPSTPAKEVTRIVLQTVIVTQKVVQTVQVPITNTPQPNLTPSLTPTRTLFPTSSIPTYYTITPGVQLFEKNIRPDVEKFVSRQSIRDYLAFTYGFTTSGGKEFCTYVPIGIGSKNRTIELFLRILCEEYIQGGKSVERASGLGMDVVLYVEWVGGYRIVGTRWVGDDGLYFKEIFPPEVQQFLIHYDIPTVFNQEGMGMESELVRDAQAFYSQ